MCIARNIQPVTRFNLCHVEQRDVRVSIGDSSSDVCETFVTQGVCSLQGHFLTRQKLQQVELATGTLVCTGTLGH